MESKSAAPIRCEECYIEVRTTDKTCHYCGEKIPRPTSMFPWTILTLGVVIAGAVFFSQHRSNVVAHSVTTESQKPAALASR